MPAEIWSKCPNVEYDATLFYDFMCFVFDIKQSLSDLLHTLTEIHSNKAYLLLWFFIVSALTHFLY